MERLQYNRYGGPEEVHLASFTLSPISPDEVVVRVAAASINPVDWKIRAGEVRMMSGSNFPRAMGTDFAGTVEAVGSRVSHVKPGDAVVGAASLKVSGAFAPKVITAKSYVVKKPDSLSFAQAATLPVVGVSAWLALVKFARLARGQRVFINGAMGAVGQAGVTIAGGLGAEVVGRVGPRFLNDALSQGMTQVLDYTQPLPEDLRGTFDVVLDCNGSLSPEEQSWLIKPSGKIVDIVPSQPKIIRALFSRSRKVIFADPKAGNLQAVVDLAAAGKLSIAVAKTVSLSDAPEALATLERGERVNGKTLIAMGE